VLRSSFRWEGLFQPVQIVHNNVTLSLSVLSAPEPCKSGQALAWLSEQTDPGGQRLDLTVAPLMTAYAVEDPVTGEWLLALLHHHIISDHHTLKLVLGDVAHQLKNSGVHGDAGEHGLPYRYYVAQALGRSQVEDEAYFKAQLSHIDTPTAPFGVYRVPVSSVAPLEQRYVVDGDIAHRLRVSTRRLGVSPAVFFHWAWAKVLGLVCGLDEVVFGTVLSGRQNTPGAERMLGVFINTLPLRIPLVDFSLAGVSADNHTLESALKTTFLQLTGLLDHEMAPLALAQRCSGVHPSTPLFTSLLNYRHTQDESLVYENGLPQLKWEGINVIRDDERTHYPVTLSINDVGDSFVLTLQTVEGIDGPLLMRCIQQAIWRLVDALYQSPAQSSVAIDIISDADKKRLFQQAEADARNTLKQNIVDLDLRHGDEGSQRLPDALEQALAEIWTELLAASGISSRSNFFDLGGHSLNMMQLSSRIRNKFGISIPVNALFELSTFQDMVSMIRAMTVTSSAQASIVDDTQETEEFSI
jgi:acyl carrier protein